LRCSYITLHPNLFLISSFNGHCTAFAPHFPYNSSIFQPALDMLPLPAAAAAWSSFPSSRAHALLVRSAAVLRLSKDSRNLGCRIVDHCSRLRGQRHHGLEKQGEDSDILIENTS
jgi:hypothetical protein